MLETDVEFAITEYLRHALPTDAVSFHIPNGGFKLGWQAIRKLKRAGWVAGVPDRCILWSGKAHFIESKRPKGDRLSTDQEEMLVRIEDAGCEWAVATSVDAVEKALMRWGIPLRARIAA